MRRIFCVILFFLSQLLSSAQDSLSAPAEKTDQFPVGESNIPKNLQLSHIEIEEQFIDFKRLNEAAYRQKLTFGEVLYQSFDSLVPFYHYPISMDLPNYLNDLTFHFAAIEWKSPHKITYSYYLQGHDKEWSKPSKDARAVYQNLPPGKYTLSVKASGEEQIWSEAFNYTFSIRRPWQLSWPAYLGYSLILIAIATGVYRLVRLRKAEAAAMRQLLEENKILAFSNKTIKMPPAPEGSFLDQVHQILEVHLSDENFGIAELCQTLNISRTQLHRKLKKLTGLSTSHYIRSLRLNIAKELLEETQLNVSEVAFTVGFSSATYFSKVFKQKFGYSPKKFR